MDYRVYVYDPDTTTFTDMSNYITNDITFPELEINPDGSPIFTSIMLNTFDDKTADFADNTLVCFEKDTSGTPKKVWWGYVKKSDIDQNTQEYTYYINNIFSNLEDYDNTTHLGAIVHSATFNGRSAFDNLSNIKSGTADIDWNDCTVKEVIEAILEADWYNGLTNVVTWSYSGDIQTVIENYCYSSLCLKYLGTDYSDETIITHEEDKFNCKDILSALLKKYGLRMYWTDTQAITVMALNTAPAKDTYTQANITSFPTPRERPLKEKKKFVLKQKMLTIQDNIDPENIHYYFSPIMFGINRNRILSFDSSGENLRITFDADHKYPATNNTKIRTIYIEDESTQNGTYEIGEDWSNYLLTTNQILLFNRSIEEVRFTRTNLGSTYSITEMVVNAPTYSAKYAEITTGTDHDAETNQYDLTISDILNSFANFLFSGTYTYGTSGAGVAYPSTDWTYNVDTTTNTLKIRSGRQYDYAGFIGTVSGGYVTEDQGLAGDPKYISNIEDYVDATAGNVKLVRVEHDITQGSGDELFIFGTGLDEYDGHSWTEQIDLASLASGEYYVINSGYLYLFDDGEPNLDYAHAKTLFPELEKTTTIASDGEGETSISLIDYLVAYRPSYSTDSDWKEDWFTVDMSDATYNTLLDEVGGIYVPYWFYYFHANYQTSYTETIKVRNGEAMNFDTSRSIKHNVRNRDIDIIQETI